MPLPVVPLRVSGPSVRTVVQRHLATVALPPRTLALVGDPREGSDPLSRTDSRGLAPTAGTMVVREALLAMVELLTAERVADSGAWSAAVRRLVGLGPGLTPTGDDLLVALGATSRLLGMEAAARALAEAIAAVPDGATTGVAHRLLTESIAGRFPAPLAEFLDVVADASVAREALTRAADRLVSTGAHSGADWLAGVVALARTSGGGRPRGHGEPA